MKKIRAVSSNGLEEESAVSFYRRLTTVSVVYISSGSGNPLLNRIRVMYLYYGIS